MRGTHNKLILLLPVVPGSDFIHNRQPARIFLPQLYRHHYTWFVVNLCTKHVHVHVHSTQPRFTLRMYVMSCVFIYLTDLFLCDSVSARNTVNNARDQSSGRDSCPRCQRSGCVALEARRQARHRLVRWHLGPQRLEARVASGGAGLRGAPAAVQLRARVCGVAAGGGARRRAGPHAL